MRRRISAIVAVGVLVSGLGATTAGATPAAPGTSTAAAQEQGEGNYDVYVGRLDARDLAAVRATGLDPHEMDITATPDGQADVEVVLSEDQATELADQGVDLELKQVDGQSVAELSTHQAAAGLRGLPDRTAAPAASRRSSSRSRPTTPTSSSSSRSASR